ncbi:MAG: efflux RND transporter periplasmic adaptor subunit [Burkholderiaceae bacterium]
MKPRDRLRFWLILATLAVVAIAALLFYQGTDPLAVRTMLGLGSSSDSATGTRPAPPSQSLPVSVEVARVSVEPLVETIQTVGSLRPDEAVTVTSEIAGRVAKIAFSEGQKVAAGDLLVQLDPSILRAELARARSELTLARANHDRNTRLARDGMASPRARDESLAALQAAQAGVVLAEARLEKTEIRAPLSGVVGLRSISTGAYLEPGRAIVELADIDPLKLDFRVPELALRAVRTGQAVRVSIDALAGRHFEGTVYAIDPIVEPGGRAIRMRARIPNPDGLLTAGLFARVEIAVDRREQALLIPDSAVFARGDGRFVYRIVDQRARLTKVVPGVRRPGRIEIIEGLADGDRVVIAGHQQLHDGALVEIIGAQSGDGSQTGA